MIAGDMGLKLYSPAELAEVFGVSERQLMDWRRSNGWPSVRIGRTIRFTQDHVDEILARHSQAPADADGQPAVAIAGQSKASAARAQRAS